MEINSWWVNLRSFLTINCIQFVTTQPQNLTKEEILYPRFAKNRGKIPRNSHLEKTQIRPPIKEDGITLSLHLAVQGRPLAIGNPNIRDLNMQDFTGRHSWDLCLRPEEFSWHGCDLWLHFVTSRAGASNCCNPPGRLLALMTTWFCSNSIWKFKYWQHKRTKQHQTGYKLLLFWWL